MEEIFKNIFIIIALIIFVLVLFFSTVYLVVEGNKSNKKKQSLRNKSLDDNSEHNYDLNSYIIAYDDLKEKYQLLKNENDNLLRENFSLNALLKRYEKSHYEKTESGNAQSVLNKNHFDNLDDTIERPYPFINRDKTQDLVDEAGYSFVQSPKISQGAEKKAKTEEVKDVERPRQEKLSFIVSVNLVKKDGSIYKTADGNYRLERLNDSQIFELIPLGQLIGSSAFLSEITPIFDIANPNDANYKPLKIEHYPKYSFNLTTDTGLLVSKGLVRYQ